MRAALLLLTVATANAIMSEDMLQAINDFNFKSKCWGAKNVLVLAGGLEQAKKACMAQDTPDGIAEGLAAPRKPRTGAEDLQESEVEFLQEFKDFKGDMLTKMGNLSCVLTAMKFVNPDLSINTDFYFTTEDSYGQFVFDVDGSAAKDLQWRQKMSKENKNCYELSETWPKGMLDSNPVTRMFGSQMVFFKCAHVRILIADICLDCGLGRP